MPNSEARDCFTSGAEIDTSCRRSFTFRIVTPVIGTRAVGGDDTNVNDSFSLTPRIDQYTGLNLFPNLGVFEPSLSEYVNKSTGIVDRFSVTIFNVDGINDLIIPVLPVYCDVSTVAIKGKEAGPEHEEFAAVSPSFVWSQPVFAKEPVIDCLTGETSYLFEASPRYNNPFDDLWVPFLFYPQGNIKNGSALFMLKNSITGKSSCGSVSVGSGKIGDFSDGKIDGVYSFGSEELNLEVALSQDIFSNADTVQLEKSCLCYESMDVLELGKNAHKIEIFYEVYPISAYASPSQLTSTTKDFSAKVGGHQPVLLVPVRATWIGGDGDGVIEAERKTYRVATDYYPISTIYDQTGDLEYPYVRTKNIYSDNAFELYSSIVRTNDELGGATVVFGIRERGSDGLVYYPQNFSPVFLPGDYLDRKLIEDHLQIVSIDNLSNRAGVASYNIKMRFDVPIEFQDISRLEYFAGCGYFIVNVFSYPVSDVCQAYTACGGLANHRLTSVSLVKETGSVVLESLSSLQTYPDVSVAEGKLSFPTLETYDTNLPQIQRGSVDNLIPNYSSSSRSRCVAGNEYSMAIEDLGLQEFSYGKNIEKFSPRAIYDGHGEASIYGSSHMLNQALFPIIYPSLIMANIGSQSSQLFTNCQFFDCNTGVTGDYNTKFYYSVLYANKTVAHENIIVGFLWYLSYCHNPASAIDALHGIPSMGLNRNTDLFPKYMLSNFCNSFSCGLVDGGSHGLNESVFEQEVFVGTMQFFQTPIIGEGNVPTTASFSKVEAGVDASNDKLAVGTKRFTFEGKELVYAGQKVYETSSVYNHISDTAKEYSLLSGSPVLSLYAVTNYLFVGYPGSTVVYNHYNNTTTKLATVHGFLVPSPAQSGREIYFAAIDSGRVVLHRISQEGVAPIFERGADDAYLSSTDNKPPMLHVMENGRVVIYVISFGTVVASADIDYVKSISLSSDSGSTTPVIFVDDYYYTAELGTVEAPYTIESSEFVFPYIEGTRVMLFGIKIHFSESSSDEAIDNIFDIDIEANQEHIYDGVGQMAFPEKVIRFPAVPVGSAKYKIYNTLCKISGIKWLIYRLPFINESLPADDDFCILRLRAARFDYVQWLEVEISGITADIFSSPSTAITSSNMEIPIVRKYEHGKLVSFTAPRTLDNGMEFVRWVFSNGVTSSLNRTMSLELDSSLSCIALYREPEDIEELRIECALAGESYISTIYVAWITNKPATGKIYVKKRSESEWVLVKTLSDLQVHRKVQITGLLTRELYDVKIIAEAPNPYEVDEALTWTSTCDKMEQTTQSLLIGSVGSYITTDCNYPNITASVDSGFDFDPGIQKLIDVGLFSLEAEPSDVAQVESFTADNIATFTLVTEIQNT